MTEVYCRGPGADGNTCDRPAFRGELCDAHTKQMQRTGKLTPIAEKLTHEDRALDAMNDWAEAGDNDEEYAARRRAAIVACKGLGRKAVSEAIKAALERARAAGKRIGRPPKTVESEVLRVLRLVQERYGNAQSITMTAEILGMHRTTVHRYLRVAKGRVSLQRRAKAERSTTAARI